MKTHKTTVATKMSVELFQCLTEYEQGSRCLRDILNDILHEPRLLLQHGLLVGWVILLPKKPQVQDATMLRPIVLGEVLVKLLTKLCIARLMARWPTPKCCFGSVKGRGVAGAAYVASVACQEAVAVGAPVVAVKLDISGAYDSLKLSPLFDWLALRWQSGEICSSLAPCHDALRIDISFV